MELLYIIDIEKHIESGFEEGIIKYSVPVPDLSYGMRYLKQIHKKNFREGFISGKIYVKDIRRMNPNEYRIYNQ